jgi:hypothetical protein
LRGTGWAELQTVLGIEFTHCIWGPMERRDMSIDVVFRYELAAAMKTAMVPR